METQAKRGRGRPEGKDFPVVRKWRLTQEQAAMVERLAARDGVTEPEAVRRAIEKAAKSKT